MLKARFPLLLALALPLVLVSRPAIADTDPSARDERASEAERPSDARLSARDIEKVVFPETDRLFDCFKRFAGTDRKRAASMRLSLIIEADGRLRSVGVRADGVPKRKLGALERCASHVLAHARFPKRRFVTAAEVPFRLMKTQARGAGPRHSCWKKTGCSSRR